MPVWALGSQLTDGRSRVGLQTKSAGAQQRAVLRALVWCRVNALEHVVKPRLENTIAYIKVGAAPARDLLSGGVPESCGHIVAAAGHRLLLGPEHDTGGGGENDAPKRVTHVARLQLYCRTVPLAKCHQGELDELEREEFFRLKKVQGNKKKHADAAVAAAAAKVGPQGGVLWVCGGTDAATAPPFGCCRRARAETAQPSLHVAACLLPCCVFCSCCRRRRRMGWPLRQSSPRSAAAAAGAAAAAC